MPNRKHNVHPALRALPEALRARMDSLGHSQLDVEAVTGVPQPQISRALNGGRKRLTLPMRELCRYAGFDSDSPPAAHDVAEEVAILLQHMIGDSAPAATHMKAVLRSLAPIMADYRRRIAVH
jgi:transcriptional regulator with XRE-family HTH domain